MNSTQLTYLMPFIFFVLGTLVGSFLSVVIERLYKKEKGIILGRSKCPKCQSHLQPLDLIPVLSYIINRGKCRSCEQSISITYPAIELVTGFTFLSLYLFTSFTTLITIFFFIIFSVLIFTFFYDLKWMEVNDKILIPTIILSAIMPFVPNYPLSITEASLGFLLPTLFFFVQILISNGRWIGGGDLRIGALMGLILGWKLALLALLVGYCTGAITSIFLLTSKKFNFKSAIPFGPFLVIGTYVAFFYGETIINWYVNTLYI